jgi:hypothetical protein
MKTLIAMLVGTILVAGCTSPAPAETNPGALEAPAAAALEPFELVWKGNVVVGVLDARNHDQPGEQVIFPFQKAGFNMEIKDMPEAIEVRVDWSGPGSFRLHPHYYKGDDASGTTQYYGYHSPTYTDGTGCIRLTDADMAPGVWPMMIHPGFDTRNIEFTITVGILGATGTVMPDLHGHRADGNYVIEEHEIAECQFLNK